MDMSKIDGFEVCERLKSDEGTKPIQVIMLSAAKTDPENRIKGLEIGVDAFLAKPIDGAELAAQVNMALRIKEAEEGKRELEGMLQKAQKMEAMAALAGGIAHDFNNILTAIIGYTEIVLSDVSKEDLTYGNLQEVLKAGRRAKDLVTQILTFSRQSAQEQRPLQPNLIVKEALKMLRASLPATIEIKQNVENDSGRITAHPTQLHQLFMNLCTNAAHAMRDEGGVLEVSFADVELDSEFTASHPDLNSGPYLRLTVGDTGHGIDPSIIDRIFEPHFTTKEEGEGTGLGLAIVERIVKSCGGDITVDSEPGKGTIFNVFLPRVEIEVPSETKSLSSLPTGKGRILFVDDEDTLARLGKQMLERLGYDVTTRTSSIEALETFSAQPEGFDLVVTDLTMPKMTGVELAEKLMAIRQDIPIILCSGFSERVTKEKAKATGIREVAMKPIVSSELAEVIRKLLDQK
jgi:signal transduction histidine kinase/BarA-like signal transduction histidine kinase